MASKRVVVPLIAMLIVIMRVVEAKTPPGIANNPSHARCLIKKYKMCYNLEHVCPKFCPNSCTVECVSCKPICSGSSPYPPPPPTTTPPSPTPSAPAPAVLPPSPPSPSPSPPTPPSTPSPSPPTPTPPSPPSPSPPTPSTPSPPSPSPPTPSPPSPSPSTPTPASPPSLSPPTLPTPSPSQPTPSTPSPSPPSPSSSSPTPPSSPSPSKTARCKSKNYPQCYNTQHVCPSSCPGGCEVDCSTCKPVCKCDAPGSVCQDPRFVGGDGITFYFHGKKDKDFCLVSDPNLHINAHFIGKRNEKMTRDFTWVQSIAILFGKHQLFLGALKTSTWDDSVDRLALSFDGQPINLPENEGSVWQSTSISITRISDTNNVVVEVESNFKITAKVVPITEQDSIIHNYGITKDDCFAHLDLGFKFYSLSDEVNGVLGQTYGAGYVSRVNVGAKMPVLGGNREFQTSSLFAADCEVARFNGGNGFEREGSLWDFELPGLSCESGIDGQGVVCKR